MPNSQSISSEQFEVVLDTICRELTIEARTEAVFGSSLEFESRVGELLRKLLSPFGIPVDTDHHPHVFPDFPIGRFGVEVKFTRSDSWRSIANSVFETTKVQGVEEIFVVFGKMGGDAEVRYDRYERCVMHVRTSHVPRFEVEIGTSASLFEGMGISYREFSSLPVPERMKLIRKYARGRLKPGERLWWLEENEESQHSLPIQARLYMSLNDGEKALLRAEASLLCPQICKPSRSKGKYDDVALYCLTYRGVLCSQARDLFSAGSVAGKERGGNYVLRALQNNEVAMIEAAQTMDSALFEEYWGKRVDPENRIVEWLKQADKFAVDWEEKPSDCLFVDFRRNS